jgi:hypothetical protein
MNVLAVDPLLAVAQCTCWEAHAFSDGPLRFVLMHVTADPSGLASGAADYRVLASARLVLRSGIVYGLGIAAFRSALLDVCFALARVFPDDGYDEELFHGRDRELAAALDAAGHGRVRVMLEHGATIMPTPAVATGRLARSLLAVINQQRTARSEGPLSSLADGSDGLPGDGDGPHDPAVVRYQTVLDAHALAYQATARTVCGVVTGTLAVYNFVVGHAWSGRNRAQALQSLPWLLPVLVASSREPIPEEVVRIRSAIDDATPLHDAVANSFNVPRGVVRWLGRRLLPADWRLDVPRLRHLLAALSWLPPERRPTSTHEFVDMVETCNLLAAPLRFDVDSSDREIVACLSRHAPCMRRWLAEVGRTGWAAGTMRRDRQRFALELSDARDFLRALAEGIQYRRSVPSEAATAIVLRWCASVGLRQLVAVSREWHASAVPAADADIQNPAGLRWPAILPHAWQHGHVTVTELTSSAHLVDEGLRMRHCVASLDLACHRGYSAIMSLRGRAGHAVSTAELRMCEDGGLHVVVEQHRSVRNGEPDRECEEALAALVLHLNDAGAAGRLRARRDFQHRHQLHARECAVGVQRQRALRAGQASELAWKLASTVPGATPLAV